MREPKLRASAGSLPSPLTEWRNMAPADARSRITGNDNENVNVREIRHIGNK